MDREIVATDIARFIMRKTICESKFYFNAPAFFSRHGDITGDPKLMYTDAALRVRIAGRRPGVADPSQTLF
jgi:hypothetical protein